MALNKQKKSEILEKLRSIFKDSKGIALVNFHGLSVLNSTEVRRSLRTAGVGYIVAKKTLAKKVLGESKFEGNMPELPGELAVAYSKDDLSPAREVYSFQKKLENKISLLGGIFQGKFLDKDGITALASIPPRETLLAQFANLINSPLRLLAVAVNEVAKIKS